MKSTFEKRLRDDLISTENNLDPKLKKQLSAARKQAIDSYRQPWYRQLQWAIWPATGMITATALVFAIMISPISPWPSHGTLIVNEQSSENIDLLEDLDFYYWLSENDEELRG
jgi:hypothetical protein